MKKYIFLLSFLGFLWAQCHKTPPPEPAPDLPPATQTGAGTIGCYINGKPWWPKPYFGVGVNQFLEVSFNALDENRFYLLGIKKNSGAGIESTMDLTVKKLSIGENIIDTVNKTLGRRPVFTDYSVADANKCSVFELDTTKSRRIIISRFDKISNIISGTFEFTAYSQCRDTLKITQGRFDTKF